MPPSSRKRLHPGTPSTLTRVVSRTTTSGRARTRTGTRTARQEDTYILAVIDNAVNDVGFCAYNLRGFDVELRQFVDSKTFVKLVTALCVFMPVEILMCVSSAAGLLDQAIQACTRLANVKRTFIGRTYFNETYGALMADKLSNVKCPNLHNLGESSCYLALACCGALIRYTEHIDEISFAPSSLKIRFRPNDEAVFLDISALEGLEIVNNARRRVGVGGKAASDCLLRAMDKTKTRAGKRFMRRCLLEPSANLLTITMRQDAVDEMTNSEKMYFDVVAILARFPDLEGAAASLMARENSKLRSIGLIADPAHFDSTSAEDSDCSREDAALNNPLTTGRIQSASPPSIHLVRNILQIKGALRAVLPLLEAIEGSQSALLNGVAESMRHPSFATLLLEIDGIIDQEALPAKEAGRMRMQGAFAVLSGRNGRLDVCRKTLSENKEDMDDLAEQTRTKYNIPKLQLSMHLKRGFHFSIHKKFLDVKDFPDEFIQIDAGTKIHRFSSNELVQLNSRYHDSLQEIWRITEIELGSLLNEIFKVEAITALHRLCDSIAILDTMASFVSYSSYCQASTERPKLTIGGPIAMQNAFHPVLLDMKPRVAIPNDVFLDETSALHLISGRNQAGKSTFIRMVGLITVMAHTGCMVPAKFASIRILKRIATRFNTSDDPSQSQSNYSKEMHDIATILEAIRQQEDSTFLENCGDKQTTPSPNLPSILILVDELGRSTSTLDGFAISYAVAEYLSSCPNVLTLFTTHFLGLGAMANINPVIKAFHLETVPLFENQMTSIGTGLAGRKFTFTVRSGTLTETSYGIDTARLAGFPNQVATQAHELLAGMPVRSIANANDFAKANLAFGQREKRQLQKTISLVSVAQRISLIQSSASDPTQARSLLLELQRKLRISQRTTKSNRSQSSGSLVAGATEVE